MPEKVPSDSDSIRQGLLLGPNTLTLLDVNDVSDIQVENAWRRGGEETYVTDFYIHSQGVKTHLIAKACIKMLPSETVKEWTARREHLQANGINVVNLIAVDGPIMVEEYIPYTLAEAYKRASPGDRARLKSKYVDCYKRVGGAGFSSYSLHDARSHGDDVVLVDFGQDLGAPAGIDRCSLSIITSAERSFRQLTKK